MCLLFVLHLTQFQEDSKAEAYTITDVLTSLTGREGTSKMRDEIQLFTDRRNDAERQVNALEREAQNNPIGGTQSLTLLHSHH